MAKHKASEEDHDDGIAEILEDGAIIVSVIAKYNDGTEIEFDPKIIKWRECDA